MPRLPEDQGQRVGRIRDALRTLGFAVPAGAPGTPGTLADLAAMAPAMGKFSARLGPAFMAAMRAQNDPIRRADLFVRNAEAVIQRQKAGMPLADVLATLGKGFMAFRSTTSPAGRVAAVLGTLSNITAASGR